MTVVVTGIGMVTPVGFGPEPFWDAVLAGRGGIAEIDRFDVSALPHRLAGLVRGFDVTEHMPARLLPQTDVSTRLALAAAAAALEDAKLDPAAVPDFDLGVVTANATGGFEFTHREFRKLWSQGPEAVSVYESFAWFYAVNTGQISIRHGLRGPGCALVAEQAGGLDAIGHASRTVRRGTPVVVCGGVDSAFDPWGWASHVSGGGVSPGTDPDTAYRPFDTTAEGYVPGEGGAILVLEDARSAAARGKQPYGEIAGHASTFDPRRGSGRPPGLRRAIESALDEAGVSPADVDVVYADALADPVSDAEEAAAIGAVFGPRGVPVTTPKPLVGRLFAGGGPVDVVAALLGFRDGLVPAVAATDRVPDAYRLDLNRGSARARRVDTALVLARGKGGFNSAVVVRACAADARTTREETHERANTARPDADSHGQRR
jgi:act minimal PKS chain-length factor (CLF/KS beta)